MADLASAATELVNSALELPNRIVDVATFDPVSAVLVALGALVMFVAMGVLGYLALGAFFSLFTVDSSPPQQAH